MSNASLLFVKAKCQNNNLPRHNEKDDGDTNVREDNANPDLLAQWIKETEHAEILLDRLFNHDAYSKRHERLTEVDNPFSLRSYSHRSYGYVRFLENN